MCGIAVKISDKILKEDFDLSLNLIQHRGPNGSGVLYWNRDYGLSSDHSVGYNVAIGHKRLSIIDLSDMAAQPFKSSDGMSFLTFNGEIYNYIELREELALLGYLFQSNSDTEVVLASILTWGIELSLKKFEGMFAFLFFDSYTGRIIVARDAFGIKPLYFGFLNGDLVFSSEVKLIRDHFKSDLELNELSAFEFLLTGKCDFYDRTFLKGIVPFPQGNWIDFNVDNYTQFTFNCFWNPSKIKRIEIGFEEAKNILRDKFLNNIKLHLRTDVPFGIALSGGLDSSAIACCIRYLYPELPIHTFSYISSDERFSEELMVDIVNSKINANSHKINIKSEELGKDYDDLLRKQDEPFVTLSLYAQYRVFKEAGISGIKVMLDGQGADELLGGYTPYQVNRLASLLHKKDVLGALKLCLSQRKYIDRSFIMTFLGAVKLILPEVASKFVSIFRLNRSSKVSWLNKDLISIDFHKIQSRTNSIQDGEYLRSSLKESVAGGLVSLLRFEDRNSMAHSIESRVPFLTKDFADFALSLPEEYLIDNCGGSKTIFREAMRGIVPDEILDRKDKIGFLAQDVLWLKNNHQLITSAIETSRDIDFLNSKNLEKSVSLMLNDSSVYNSQIFRVLNFCHWIKLNGIKYE
jgi:asparagine synthase (glutamine-hydrolysing)